MLIAFIIFYSVQFCVVIVLLYGKKQVSTKVGTNSEKTTVLFPFKNEKNRISELLNSINRSLIKYKKTGFESNFQFIFIDDHSSDGTSQFISDNLDACFQILKLDERSGKKAAIEKGVEYAKYERILTLDADVHFGDDYLSEISKVKCTNLTVLPVEMCGSTLFQKLFSVEFWFLQHITFGLAGLGKYVLCNGANLLFTKNTFNATLEIRKDINIPSGDDMFLLKAVKDLKLDVCAVNNSSLIVQTSAEFTFRKLLNQRVRWVSKTKDLPSVLVGMLVLMSNLIFLTSVYEIMLGNFLYTLPILIKVLSEWISINAKSKLVLVLLHQVYYPFYLIGLILKMMFSRTIVWK